MNSKVSIIVPVYKTKRFLNRCIDSIRRQDYTNIEILLVDDGSPDESGTMCDEIAQLDSRIQVIHKENGGLSSARNAGLDLATGEYICFIDSDDYVAKDYVSTLYNIITNNKADLAKINYIEIDVDNYEEREREANVVVFEGKDVETAYLNLRVDSACVFLYKKTLIGETRFPIGRTSEDIPFNFELFQKAQKFVYMPVNKYYYYHNPDSISNGPLDKNMLNYMYFREDIYLHYCKSGDKELESKAEALYARAVMGLMARMALYGIAEGMEINEYKALFAKSFRKHKKTYFKDSNIEFSRKVLAVLVFYFYPVTRILRPFMK